MNDFSIIHSGAKFMLPIKTLMEEIKPVFMEKDKFENQE